MVKISLLGIPHDDNSSFLKGPAEAPPLIRRELLCDAYSMWSETGVDLGIAGRLVDHGDAQFDGAADPWDVIEQSVARALESGDPLISLGGDHAITHPIMRAVRRRHPQLTILHIDAHCDTGGPFEGAKFHHGGPFRQAVLAGVIDPERTIQIGIRGGAEYLWEFSYISGMTVMHAEEFAHLGVAKTIKKIRDVVGSGPTYISFDVDSLDPAFAPGTGTPEAGGLSTREAMELVRGCAGLNVIGGDVVEVAPQYDATTNTAQAAAQMLFEILAVIALARRKSK